ncbi:MAG: amino acid permease [Emergencia sp.]|nr:amino acid permease [Emergencia sp.]
MENEKRLEELTTEKTEFKREIGVFGGVSIIGGIMIGSGIFYLGSYVLQRTGMNSGLALICWIIAGVISLFGGLCYAELGTAMPKAGGRLVYLNEAFHPVVGFMAGFTDWLIGGPGSIAAVSIALMAVFQPFFGLSDFGVKAAAIVLIVAATLYNLVGVKIASIVQSLSMVAKLVPVAIILFAAIFVGRVSPDLSLGSASEYAAANDTNMFGMIAIAVVAALWAYEGWTNLNTVAEEIKNPKKNLPLALIIGIGGVTIIYTLFNFAIMKVLPHEEIVTMINNEDIYLGTAVAEKVLGSAGAFVVSAGMVLAMFGSMNGMILAQPRMYYAMAEEGHFFKCFAKLHPKYKVPYAPIIVQGVLSIVLVLVRNLEQLTNMVVVTGMVFNVLVVLAVPILRKKYPKIERPYKVWFYPVSVIITALIFVGLLINSAIDDPVTGAIGFCVPAAGAVVYYIFDVIRRKEMK